MIRLLVTILMMNIFGSVRSINQDRERSKILVHSSTLAQPIVKNLNEYRAQRPESSLNRHCQIVAVSKTLSKFQAPTLKDPRKPIMEKSFNRRRAMEQVCTTLSNSENADFSTEC